MHTKINYVTSALAITALLFSVRVFSAPYSISHTGTVANPRGLVHPDVNQGESFSVTMVMDNGGATAASQNWGGGDLQCLIFEFNDARDNLCHPKWHGPDKQPPAMGAFCACAESLFSIGRRAYLKQNQPEM